MRMDNEFVQIPKPASNAPPPKKKPSIIILAVLWFFTAFCFLGGLAAFPSLSSTLLFTLSAILFPLNVWQEKLRERGFRGTLKAACAVILFFAACVIMPGVSQSKTNEPAEPEKTSVSAPAPERQEMSPAPSENAAPQSVSYINADFDGDGYERISAELLYEYGQYMEGRKVVTVVKAARDSYSDRISAETDGREDALTYSVSCELSAKIPEGAIQKGDLVTIAGTIDKMTPLLSTVTLKDCSIIGKGEIAGEIKEAESYYREICERYKKAHDDAIAAAERDERESYIAECVAVSYADVERNPDNYKKTKIKVSGSVEQVIEGWFNTVTLRVKDSNGNTWVISYLRQEGESRILEGDSITAYGECNGVTNVTNLLGQQMTYPSMNMKYFKQ